MFLYIYKRVYIQIRMQMYKIVLRLIPPLLQVIFVLCA